MFSFNLRYCSVDDRGAELLYGERLYRTRAAAFDGSVSRDCGGSGETDGLDQGDASCSARSLSEEERRRLKDRYSMEYSRYIPACCNRFSVGECQIIPGAARCCHTVCSICFCHPLEYCEENFESSLLLRVSCCSPTQRGHTANS